MTNNLHDIKNEITDYLKACDEDPADYDVDTVAYELKQMRDRGATVDGDNLGRLIFEFML